MALFPASLRRLLQKNTTPWGEVYPPRANPNSLPYDGRTVALNILGDYLCALDYFQVGSEGGRPIKFSILRENFYVEWPDSTEEMPMPSITVVSSRADYNVIGLVAYIEEDTRDVFAPGTVVQWQSEYTETINLEVWCGKKAQRRGILNTIETAITPTEQMSGVRFVMPAYYNELVCFTLNRREVMDEPDSARNRRRAQLEIEMRFNIVALVNYRPLDTRVSLNADVDQYGVTVDLSVPNAQTIPYTR